jgi:hypothetical protein
MQVRTHLLSLAVCCQLPLAAQKYWQQELHYEIRVALLESARSLRGFEKLQYVNRSPDTLHFIWFHLWPNAYKNKSTAFYLQMEQLGLRNLSLAGGPENGYMDSLLFRSGGNPLRVIPDSLNIDIVKVILPGPLVPGDSVTLTTPFFVKVPPYFSRLGHDGESFYISQWYPKPAVYDSYGWHPMPYLEQGEFYSEFGSFDVHITVPASYKVAATGQLLDQKELSNYRAGGGSIPVGRNNPESELADSARVTKTLEFTADRVHDFAWFADKQFRIYYDTLRLPSGKIIDLFAFCRRRGNPAWTKSIGFMKDAILHYSRWVGEYPYPVVKAVEGPNNEGAGGMEYPMITLISEPAASPESLDGTLAHEIGHNWFYGALGSNERDHAWMDEGVNSYYEFRYEAEKYGNISTLPPALTPEAPMSPEGLLKGVYEIIGRYPNNPGIDNPSTEFTEREYDFVVYYRGAWWMSVLEKALGEDKFESGMHAYFRDWKFKHPYPSDMRKSLERNTGVSLRDVFRLLF